MSKRQWIIGVFLLLTMLWLCAAAIAANEATEYEAIVVRPDQTLATIAQEYRMPVEYLAQFNRLQVTDRLTAGQVLLVPIVPEDMVVGTPPPFSDGQGAAAKPAPGQVTGWVGRVSVERVDIRSKPNGGQLLFSRAQRDTSLLVIGESGEFYAVLMSDGSTGFLPKTAVELSETQMTVQRPVPAKTDPQVAPGTEGRQDLVATALEYLGVPYRYGGHLPNNVDCSLLVQTVFSRHGIRLPRTAAQQFTVGTPVDVKELRAGDRLYFYDRSGRIGHTGLYMGNGRFVHASSNRGQVAIDELNNSTYWRKYAGARR